MNKSIGNVKIESGIQEPPARKCGGKSTYPWEKMNIGDSFLFPSNVERPTAYISAKRAEKRASDGRKFKVALDLKGKLRACRIS